MAPITKVLKRQRFLVDQQSSFDNIKEALYKAPVFALLDFEKSFQVEVDVSGVSVRRKTNGVFQWEIIHSKAEVVNI